MTVSSKFWALLFIAASVSCTQKNTAELKESSDEAKEAVKPKNIILLIGDGMGLSQVSSAFYYQDATKTNFSRFPVIGLINTSSAKQKVTDSAAGATAFATGERTYNGAISVDVDTANIPLAIDAFDKMGKSIGLVSTSSITHATPACFYAHADARKKEDLIASQMHNSVVDFFAGGGINFFAHRKDGFNYLDSLRSNGFTVDTTALNTKVKFDGNSKYGFLLAGNGMKPAPERGNFLPEATQTALDFLSKDEEGFFLMVEGSQIDWGGHANNADHLIAEVLDFDKTLGVALDFAEKNPGTLIVVTADHETGGFTLASKDGDYSEISPTFSTGGHSATLIPVFSYGVGSENFGGVYNNIEIHHKIMDLFK